MVKPAVKYPIGIQDFESLRNDGYIYVDKTALVYKLISENKYVFLARPRRFGKSLLLSTLKAYFEGKSQLFDGLALAGLEQDWTPGPVLMLSLSRYNRSESNSLEALLDTTFRHWEKEYGIEEIAGTLSLRFSNIILSAYHRTGRRVTLLVDEYDAPMVAHLGDEDRHRRVRDLLKSVYVNIKDMDHYIRFAMFTGVSRFSRTSIFSGLNNLKDITFNTDYSEICGITESELETYFPSGINALAAKLQTDYTGALHKLKANYDGYHFTEDCEDIYNPFSLLSALSESKIKSYWFATGTPTFLFEAIHNTSHFLPEYFNEEVEQRTLAETDTYHADPLALMFQTGYLTIKEYDSELQTYRLGLPNLEVRQGLSSGLLKLYMNIGASLADSELIAIRRAFRDGLPDNAMEHIKAFLARIPYELAGGKDEIYFENNLYLLFNLIGIDTAAEYHTSRGRIDLLVKMPKFIYVIELKLDGTPEDALAQIEERGYAAPFVTDSRKLFKIGINFSRETRNIDSWIITD